MVLTIYSGLRFEVITPSRYIFRLGEDAAPMFLEYRGAVWHLGYMGEESATFLSRNEATDYLRGVIDKAEKDNKTTFDFCVVYRGEDG